MIITLSPIRMDATLDARREGAALILNGERLDFAGLAEGRQEAGHASPWIAGPVLRSDGRLHLVLILPHGPDAPPEVLFPAALIDPPDGPLVLPRGLAPADAVEAGEEAAGAGAGAAGQIRPALGAPANLGHGRA